MGPNLRLRLPSNHARPAARRAVVGLSLCLCACAGPTLAVEAPGPRFVDGEPLLRPVVPFRYYGTVVLDALPADLPDGRPDWSHVPLRQRVELPPPASRWLFPLDLPIELLQRTFAGRADREVALSLPAPVEPVVEGFQPDLDALAARALAARTSR